MITTEQANQQINRLRILRYPPERMADIIAAFQEYARNYEHAIRMVDWLVRRHIDFPVQVEIAEAAEATFADEDRVKPDRRCKHCEGTGYEQCWALITNHKTPSGGAYVSTDKIFKRETAEELKKLCDGINQILYDCVRECPHCRYGMAITAAVAARKQQKSTAKEEERSKGMRKAGVDLRKFAAGDDD